MFNSSGEREYPCLIPDVRGEAFSLSPLSMILIVGFSFLLFDFYYDEVVFFSSCLAECFYYEGCSILSSAFSASVEMMV